MVSWCKAQKTIQTPFEFRLVELFPPITFFPGFSIIAHVSVVQADLWAPQSVFQRLQTSSKRWYSQPCCSVWKWPRVVWCSKFICQLLGYRGSIRGEWTKCRKILIATTKIREMAANWQGGKVCEKLMERVKKERSTVTIRLMMRFF